MLDFLQAVPQRNDTFYDELSHASIRDGILMSHAKAYKFEHNDLEDLEKLILKQPYHQRPITKYLHCYRISFLHGRFAQSEDLVQLSEKYNCYLVIDEAHA